ncbi:MAG: glycosyltransferase, partial [Fidelibacterota bacterium]
MKRVGIFQNTFTAGGRIKVVLAMTRVFNELDVVPDLIAFRSTLSEEKLTQSGSPPVRARLRVLRNVTRGLSEYKYVRLNQRIDALSDEYELLVNSNNTLASLRGSPNLIHYVHFPREARLLDRYSNSMIHSRLARVLFLKMYRSFQKDVTSSGAFMANSDFTKSAMLDVYPLDPDDIRVIYPPVDGGASRAEPRREIKRVISLGRFGENKNQLFQIEIAEKVPEAQFSIVGFVNNARSLRYFRRCERKIHQKGLSNVTLIRDAHREQVANQLSSASVFLHTMADEPFGLSTVESMSFGCIPLCHNSGGQKEIVANPELLFTSLRDAVSKLKRLIKMKLEESDAMRRGL